MAGASQVTIRATIRDRRWNSGRRARRDSLSWANLGQSWPVLGQTWAKLGMVAACRALEGEGRPDKLRGVSAFLRSSLARWSSIFVALAVATTTAMPAAGAEPAPIQKPAARTAEPAPTS